ncbi:MAG TPA: SWIM zinc finger family protein [Anaeromyxobacteraceae bacterium]
MAYGSYYGEFPAYVSVAERRKRAARKLAQLRKQGREPAPIVLAPRGAIASTFWGKAWCEHLEAYADYASRLPRGLTYVRNGSVIDLQIAKGEVRGIVSGSELYDVTIAIAPLAAARWKAVRKECAGQIGTVVELLSGKLSSAVMEKLCHRERGLFPGGKQIEMRCSCPDGAWLCKHLAAVLYGVGARLDEAPELLFTLRGVDGAELIAAAGDAGALAVASGQGSIASGELADIFGIELEPAAAPEAAGTARARGSRPRATARPPSRRVAKPPRRPRAAR